MWESRSTTIMTRSSKKSKPPFQTRYADASLQVALSEMHAEQRRARHWKDNDNDKERREKHKRKWRPKTVGVSQTSETMKPLILMGFAVSLILFFLLGISHV